MSLRRALVATGVVALMATSVVACSKNSGDDKAGDDAARQQNSGALGTAEDSKGPAPEVAGATPGGDVTAYRRSAFDHADPARAYYVDVLAMLDLVARRLTNYKELGDGRLVVVGDLATDPGTDVNGDCKTWKYTLKDGIKYQDGSPIKAADIAYGVGRAFSPNLAEGPHYIQQWLTGEVEYNKDYKGPYDGGAAIPPGVDVPDEKTIVFNFKTPACEAPFALAMGISTPVPAAKDTKDGYDKEVWGSGPYKIKDYQLGQSMTVEKNEFWDKNTDPIRHQYVDTMTWKFGQDQKTVTQRLMADQGADATSFDLMNEDPSFVGSIVNDAEMMKRVITGTNIFVNWLAINTERISDVNVRKALQYVIDKEAYMKIRGGPTAGTPATTNLSPTAIGYNKFDAYTQPVTGDKEKAKQLLAGKVTTLKYAYPNTEIGQQVAAFMKEQFGQVGITLEIIALDPNTAPDILTNHKSNVYDLYPKNWGADWPTGSTVIPPLFDGRTIADEGNVNNSWFNDAGVNAEIDRINKLPVKDATAEWGKLDQKIMTDFAPVVPMVYDGNFSLYGSNIGGAYLSKVTGTIGLSSLFLKS